MTRYDIAETLLKNIEGSTELRSFAHSPVLRQLTVFRWRGKIWATVGHLYFVRFGG
jgi:hypothetical protein